MTDDVANRIDVDYMYGIELVHSVQVPVWYEPPDDEVLTFGQAAYVVAGYDGPIPILGGATLYRVRLTRIP